MFILHDNTLRVTGDGITRDATLQECRMLAAAIYDYSFTWSCREPDTMRKAMNDIYRALDRCGYRNVRANRFFFEPVAGKIEEIRSNVRVENVYLPDEIQPLTLEQLQTLFPSSWYEIYKRIPWDDDTAIR